MLEIIKKMLNILFLLIRLGNIRRHFMESLYAKSYLHFLKFSGFENYDNILEDFFKDNLQNEIYLELKNISDNSMETFKYFENYFKNNEMSFDEEKFEVFLMSGIKKEYSETNNIAEFGSKCYDLWEKLPEGLSEKEPFLALRDFKERIKEAIKAEKLEYEVIHNINNLKKALISFVILVILDIIYRRLSHFFVNIYEFAAPRDIAYCFYVAEIGLFGVFLAYIIKYFYIKKRKYLSGVAIFTVLVLIHTAIFIWLFLCIGFVENFQLFLFFLCYSTGPLLLSGLLYHFIKKKLIEKKLTKCKKIKL